MQRKALNTTLEFLPDQRKDPLFRIARAQDMFVKRRHFTPPLSLIQVGRHKPAQQDLNGPGFSEFEWSLYPICRFDYLARDSMHLGIPTSFNSSRILNFSKVCAALSQFSPWCSSPKT